MFTEKRRGIGCQPVTDAKEQSSTEREQTDLLFQTDTD